ncbi:MAG: VCBS repeat-containing protein [Chloroflexi bacterium]|nr:VCBS repeat-containing protein [Chloroflexota bacterium]
MFPNCKVLFISLLCFALSPLVQSAPSSANRLTYLDENDPFYVGRNFPKLATPQWIGEAGVEAVVILAIDDLREPQKYETFLRPILERLKQIDGRAPVSIFCNALDPQQPQLQAWLKEGLSLEIHTLSHPCPLLAQGNFGAAAHTYHGGIDLLHHVPGNVPVAFRMPCCDSMNSPSPRFYAELFNQTNSAGQFLTIDSSVMNIPTSQDAAAPRDLVVDPDGREKFRKYLPAETNAITRLSLRSFVTTIEDYPYPYVIGKLCWEFPSMIPSDWEAQNLHGTNNPITVRDWKAALDLTVLKQGTFTFIFHPHGWILPGQLVEFIDYAVQKYGGKVKFLNFREAQERLNHNLLAGQPLRAANGQDNGVRLVDLNHDGCVDVVIGNELARKTRLWKPESKAWLETSFPTSLVVVDPAGVRQNAGVKFGIVRSDGQATILAPHATNAWHFVGDHWTEDKSLWQGLEISGQAVLGQWDGRDRGVRFRDVDNDGRCELLVANETHNVLFAWSPEDHAWKKLDYALPPGVALVDAQGRDRGLRFVDLNEDGFADIVFSNEEGFSLHLFTPKPAPHLRWEVGWTQKIKSGQRGQANEIPMIVRGGTNRNNGAWFHSRHLWVQNEDTARWPDKVDRRSFEELLAFDAPPPQSPEESLASIRVRPGFKVELVAHEPLLEDPVAFDWAPDGKLWVAEMVDYPAGMDGQGKPGGIVRFLEDLDGDGRYDKSTVFLEGLNFPNGIMPWDRGVLISAAPEILYAEDTDGDGKADVRKPLLVGFNEGNQQHRVNGFEYGLDNWVYAANGDSGGEVRSVLTGKTINIRGHDLRFRPQDGAFETVAGQTQFGRRRDDWGNWFGNNNPTWLWHYFLPEQYLARNPHLAVKQTKQYLANYPENTRLHSISRPVQRFNWPDLINILTSACSATPYRDELFGPDFAGSVFICEPANNLIRREVLQAEGVSFASHRAADEQNVEFLASTDTWFRAVMLKTGPDGALYFADMYRLVIEHIEYGLPGMEKQIDLRAGADKGRIYRVYPAGATLRKIPRLDQLDTSGLVAALDSPNGWQRDTAQRLLVPSGDKAAAPLLARLVLQHPRPQTRLQALCTLEGLQALNPELLMTAMQDAHPAIREHAVHWSEPFLSQTGRSKAFSEAGSGTARTSGVSSAQSEKLGEALLKLEEDADARVRYQLAFSLGEWADPRAARALTRLALRDVSSSALRTAVMSSAVPHVEEMVAALLARSREGTAQDSLLADLLGLTTALGNDQAVTKALLKVAEPVGQRFASWQLAALNGVLDALSRRSSSLGKWQSEAKPELKAAITKLEPLFQQARQAAFDLQAAEAGRLAAIRLLGRGKSDQEADARLLVQLLSPQHPAVLQKAALAALDRMGGDSTAPLLLSGWRSYSPTLKLEVLDTFFRRAAWLDLLLGAVEKEEISRGQIGAVYQQKLLAHSQESIRDRARRLFSSVNPDRQMVLKQYEAVASLTGDPADGAALFKQHCAVCHSLKGEGNSIGPDLAALTDKSIPTLLVAILDPNRAVEAPYVNYTAVTRNDREVSGVIVSETPNSLNIRTAVGSEEVILRADLLEFGSSGLSLMPEGFEKAFQPQDLADLIAYIAAGVGPGK